MSRIRADRLRQAIEDKSISQSELARRVGISQASIAKLVSGEGQGSKYLHKIASELGTSPEYLMGESDDPTQRAVADRRTSYIAQEETPTDLVQVVVSDVSYGMGGAFIDDHDAEVMVQQFPRSFIRQFTKGPFNDLYFAIGIGDSMSPTIHNSDLVLIDRSQKLLRVSDQLWALAAGAIGMIKRVRVLPNGSILLVSDNPDVSDYAVGDDELHLIGRVVAVVKKL